MSGQLQFPSDEPENQIKKLQGIQNTAAQRVFKIGRAHGVTNALQELHWLPVKHHIDF